MFIQLAIVSILGSPQAIGCTNGANGRIVDAVSGKPLQDIQLLDLNGRELGATHSTGKFSVQGLCGKTLDVLIKSRTHEEHQTTLRLSAEDVITIRLKPLTALSGPDRSRVKTLAAKDAATGLMPAARTERDADNMEGRESSHQAVVATDVAESTPTVVARKSTGLASLEATDKNDSDSQSDDASKVEEVVVLAKPRPQKQTHSVATLDETDLQRSRGKTLADTVAEIPGVTVLRSGNNAKPVVRGQYGARLLMLYDGVRHEGQDWGLDHAPEIDPFAAGSIQVVKGAAGVRYGSDAIGGVLLVEPPGLLLEPGLRVETQTVYATNNRRATGALRIEGTPSFAPRLAWRLDGNYSRGAALQTPDYPLDNTGIEEWNGGGTVLYRQKKWDLKLSLRRNRNRTGVCLCMRKETTDDFDAQVRAKRPLNSEFYRADYEIERPYQFVTHDVAIARSNVELGDTFKLESTYAYQVNDRKEYEIIRTDSAAPQYIFTLRTHTADLVLSHAAVEIGQNVELTGMMGLSGILQENVYRGWPLLSDYRAFGGGLFALERLIFDGFELEFGTRFDHTTRHAYLPKKTFESLRREGRIDSNACTEGEEFSRCNTRFNTTTFSAGGLIHFMKGFFGTLNLSTATRVPTIDEQYLNGTSPSFPVMARGNHTLDAETSYSASTSLNMTWPLFKGEISTHASFIDDYIYLSPELRDDGTIRTDVLIQGRFPRFSFDPINALFYGVDAGGEFRFGPLGLGFQGSIVRAENIDNNEFLLFIPPDQGKLEIIYRFPWSSWLSDPQFAVSGTFVAPQYNVATERDFAPVPDGYTLLGVSGSTTLNIGDGRYLFSVEAQNLLNTRYRDYTSILRYFADEPGRQVFLRFGTQFGPER